MSTGDKVNNMARVIVESHACFLGNRIPPVIYQDALAAGTDPDLIAAVQAAEEAFYNRIDESKVDQLLKRWRKESA